MLRTCIHIKVNQKVRLAYIMANNINDIIVDEQLFTSTVAAIQVTGRVPYCEGQLLTNKPDKAGQSAAEKI